MGGRALMLADANCVASRTGGKRDAGSEDGWEEEAGEGCLVALKAFHPGGRR